MQQGSRECVNVEEVVGLFEASKKSDSLESTSEDIHCRVIHSVLNI